MKTRSGHKRYNRAVREGFAPRFGSYGRMLAAPAPSIFGGDMIAALAMLAMRRGR